MTASSRTGRLDVLFEPVMASQALKRIEKTLRQVAEKDVVVTFWGESGTGKDVLARRVHELSARRKGPFVPINCAAIPEALFESELFGRERGAFTGASERAMGKIEAASGGTLFLDEVAELPLSVQPKLLRFLEGQRFMRLGGTTKHWADVRLVLATLRPLEDEVKAGRFREDLLFRLNVITIEVPPLRERREDIVPMAQAFLSRVSEELGRPSLQFAPETLALLERYAYSGNVRQLQNIVERAATLSDSDLLEPMTLPPAVRGEPVGLPAAAVTATVGPGFSLNRALDELERALLLDALKQADGMKARAAQLLGLTFRSFRYRLAKHGLGENE